jgi:hypothetical protein
VGQAKPVIELQKRSLFGAAKSRTKQRPIIQIFSVRKKCFEYNTKNLEIQMLGVQKGFFEYNVKIFG